MDPAVGTDYFVGIAQHALWVLALASMPILVPALIAGLVLGMIQAATLIQQRTLAFVPKSIVVGVCLALFAVPTIMIDSHEDMAVAKAPPEAGGALCVAGETPIFTCRLGAKRASVCGSGRHAVYRYGSPGKVELAAGNLALAKQAFSGGGETQIQVSNRTYGYVLFDKTSRTGFGNGGQNDPDSRSGLLVRHAGKTISSRECDDDAPIPERASTFISAHGAIVAH